MLDLWESLLARVSNYTIADMASIFAIIEGFATVVAAVGAIIAVVVTKKIAVSQIEIAKEQNKISSKQAEIAAQQNKIALLEKRSALYDKLNAFCNHWRLFSDEKSLEELKKIPSIDSLQAYISLREFGTLNTEYLKDKDIYALCIKHSVFVFQDIECLNQIRRLFYLPSNYLSSIDDLLVKYYRFSTEVHSLSYPTYSTLNLEKLGREVHDEVNSQQWIDLL